jgi:nitrogen fixation/metabolism regulation signal transduction histidine kinase
MAKQINQRRIVLIEPRLQFRYLVLPLVVSATTAAALLALFVVQAETLKGLAGSDRALLEEIQTVQTLSIAAAVGVLIGHVGLIVWLGLTLSHRLAGPIYRLKKSMKQVAEGDREVRIHLRRRDELTDVATQFNEMVDAVEKTERELKEKKEEEGGEDAG